MFVALLQTAIGAAGIPVPALPGEYKRSYNSYGIPEKELPGIQLTLRAGGSFDEIAIGNVNKSLPADSAIVVGETGRASGHWEQNGNQVRLTPKSTSGVLKQSLSVFQIRECDGQPA